MAELDDWEIVDPEESPVATNQKKWKPPIVYKCIPRHLKLYLKFKSRKWRRRNHCDIMIRSKYLLIARILYAIFNILGLFMIVYFSIGSKED